MTVAAAVAVVASIEDAAPPEPRVAARVPEAVPPPHAPAPRARPPRQLTAAEQARLDELKARIREWDVEMARNAEEMAERASNWGCAIAADGTLVVPDWVKRNLR